MSLSSLLVVLVHCFGSTYNAGGVVTVARPVVSVWNYSQMLLVRESLERGESRYQRPYSALIREANKMLSERPTSVMDKPDEKVANSKDKHDFISVGKYCWPNPNTPDGMPWIQRDGYINVENFKKDDAVRLDNMVNSVTKLCLAYFFSNDVRYADKAAKLINVWFIAPATRMNPNFNYAQVIPGNDNNMGHFPGIIFGRALVNVLGGVCLIQHSSVYTSDLDKGIREWFSAYRHWLTTSEMGLKESKTTNNHAIAYDEQVLAMDLFLGDSGAAKRLVSEFHENRIFKQVEPDGKMPRELTRTRALGYSAFNVKHMLEMSEMARDLDTSFYAKTSPDGRCIGAAVDYIARYLGKNPKDFFPYRQIADWDKCMEEIAWIVKWASVFDSSKGYISMFEKHSPGMADDVNQLLY